MKITSVNGYGKCIECGNETSIQMWIGKMQFYFCDHCVNRLSTEAKIFIKNHYKE